VVGTSLTGGQDLKGVHRQIEALCRRIRELEARLGDEPAPKAAGKAKRAAKVAPQADEGKDR
jgi:hypothetical protein